MLQSSYTSRRLADRIRIMVLEYGSGPLPYLGRSRMLQSSYTSRRLADRIRILRSVDTDQETGILNPLPLT